MSEFSELLIAGVVAVALLFFALYLLQRAFPGPRVLHSMWLWGGTAALAFTVGLVFLILAAQVDVDSSGCRSAAHEGASARAFKLLDVAVPASLAAVVACLLGLVFVRGLRIVFLGGVFPSLFVLGLSVLYYVGTALTCAFD